MIVTNRTPNVYELPGLKLHASEVATVSNAKYLSDEHFRGELNALVENGKVSVTGAPDGFPVPIGSDADEDERDAAPVLRASVSLSSAQLLDLHNTAVELLPAPGGRFYYDVQHIVWHYRYGGIPYSGTWDDCMIGFYPAGVPFPDYDPLNNTLTTFSPWGESSQGFNVLAQTEDVYQMAALPRAASAVGWLASNIENLPLSTGLQNLSSFPDPAVPWTDGNGTLTIRVFYSLINGAPS